MEYTGWRKYFVATWAFVETFLFGGLIYGWVPVVWIFKQEKIYADLCPANHTTSETNVSIGYDVTRNMTSLYFISTQEETCDPQDKKFALAFTIGSSLFCASSALTGYIIFKLGTRVTRICSMCVYFKLFKNKHPT